MALCSAHAKIIKFTSPRPTLADVGPGSVELHVSYNKNLTQQHGFFHGGVIGAIADNAGGYASFSLMAASDSILTIEYKLNIMSPADGELLISRGQVLLCQILIIRDV